MNKLFNRFLSVIGVVNAHASRSTTVDPLQKFKFRVTIPGVPGGMGFQKVSGLSIEIPATEYFEAGYDFAHKIPGRSKVPEVVCERGEYSDDYFKSLVMSVLTNPNIRQTVIIEKLTRSGQVAKTYKLAECWASKWEGSDMDATSDDVAVEKITFQFEYFL